jgi:hypothetical protein
MIHDKLGFGLRSAQAGDLRPRELDGWLELDRSLAIGLLGPAPESALCSWQVWPRFKRQADYVAGNLPTDSVGADVLFGRHQGSRRLPPRLVSWFRSSPHYRYRTPSELRNRSDTRNQKVASVPSIPKLAQTPISNGCEFRDRDTSRLVAAAEISCSPPK